MSNNCHGFSRINTDYGLKSVLISKQPSVANPAAFIYLGAFHLLKPRSSRRLSLSKAEAVSIPAAASTSSAYAYS